MREKPFFHTNHKHDGKLQTLGRVGRHQSNSIWLTFLKRRLLRSVFSFDQGDVLQKVFYVRKFGGYTTKFLHVLDSGSSFEASIVQPFQVVDGVEELVDDLNSWGSLDF